MADFSSLLVPSERVYLHAEAFARERTLKQAVGVLQTDKKVDAAELNAAVLSAAVLGAEQAGVVKLRVGEQSKWFGLRKAPGLFFEPGPTPGVFPPGTLEGDLPAMMGKVKTGIATSVIRELLRADSSWPELNSLDLVKQGLAKRGLLTTEQEKRLGLFKVDVYRVPESTRALRQREGPEEVKRLFDDARTNRPQEWALLQEAIVAATKSRKEYDSDGPD